MEWVKFNLAPRFYEIDSYNMVNHMFYLSWFEMGRFAVAEKAGILSPRFKEEGFMFVVSEVNISYKKPVGFLDKVIVETALLPAKACKLVFRHRIRSMIDKSIFCEGTTATVCVQQGKMTLKLPEWIDTSIRNYIENIQKGYPI